MSSTPFRHARAAAALCSGAVLSIACTGGASREDVSARDRAVAATDSSRAALQSNVGAGTVAARGTSLGQAEATAAKRAATRRAVLTARKQQDEVYERRGDDLTFVETYKVSDRNDSLNLYLYGRALGKINRIDDAILEFEASILADENNPWPFEGLGICYFLNNQPDRSIAQLKKALDVDPDLAEARFALARALDSVGRRPEAIAEAELVLRNDEEPTRGPLLVAELRVKNNELDKACNTLDVAVKKTPDNMALRLAYADALGRNGKPAEAAAQLDEALAKGKLPPEKLHDFAILYRRADRFDRSLELLKRLINEASADYWHTHPRQEIDELRDKLERERQVGHRLEYNVSELLQMMGSHPDVKKRQFAMDSLRQFPFPEVDQAFVMALKDKSAQIRALAIPEILRRAGEGAQRLFCKLATGDPEPRVRAAACAALSKMDSEETELTLVAALGDNENMTREAANAALETLTGRILRPAGIPNLDEPGRKELAQEWKRYLVDRRKDKQDANADPKSNNPNSR